MANYPQKTNVPVAVQSRSHDPLSHVTIASQDFGLVMPISCQYMVPGDKFNIKVDEVTRLLPMVNPAYVKCDSIVSAFAVPISYIYQNFNDFISGELSGSSTSGSVPTTTFRPNTVPHTPAYMFRAALISAGLAKVSEYETDPIDFKRMLPDTTVPTNYYFTWKGKRLLKVLQGLGYNFNFNDPMGSADPDEAYLSVYGYSVSLIPLLSFIKFYVEWIVPARFADQYATVRASLQHSYGSNAALAWNLDALKVLFIDFASYLDNDYFTSAWKYPASPENGMETFDIPSAYPNGVPDISHSSHEVDYGAFIAPSDLGGDKITSLSLQSVGALQSMLNRGMITGNKIKDWLKTEFGIEPSKDALKMSSFLGMSRNTFRIGEVFSSADTAAQGGQPLGSYAGRGNGAGSAQFSYSADQHSVLIITAQIIPHSVYYQGIRPLNLMLDRFSFFQPEFDNVGVRALSRKELFNDTDFSGQDFSGDDEDYMNGIFGFTPQYANLKVGYDNVIGDFRLKRFENDLSSWFAARKFKVPQQNQYYNNINANFCKVDGIENALGYDDLFTYQGTDIDHFYSLFDVQIATSRPMVSLSDALTLPEDKGARKVGVNTNNNPNV